MTKILGLISATAALVISSQELIPAGNWLYLAMMVYGALAISHHVRTELTK